MEAELTIVIPAKNEVQMLPKLLKSLCKQDYEGMARQGDYRGCRVDRWDGGGGAELSGPVGGGVIPGGLPSVGRNAGAKLASTKYVLFLDADVELPEPTLLRRALWRMRRRNLHLATTNIACRHGGFFDDALYAGNNLMQYIGSFLKRLATGMFMLFDVRPSGAGWITTGFVRRGLSAVEGRARTRFRVVRARC